MLQAHLNEALPLAARRFARGDAAVEISMSKPATRFDVRMSEELAQEFEEIQQATGMSGAEVFRRAIALYRIAKKPAEMANRSSSGPKTERGSWFLSKRSFLLRLPQA